MHMAMKTGQQYVVAWQQHVDGSFALHCHASSHKEVDTKIIFHAIKAKERGATLYDVYSLSTAASFPRKLHLSQVEGHNREEYGVRRYMMIIGPAKAAALHLRELTLQGLWW